MNRSALRHVPMLSGQVQLTLTGDDGKQSSALVDGAYLRAKCIGILADLDPHGLVTAALGQRYASINGDARGLSPADQILIALLQGPKTSKGLRVILTDRNLSAQDISARTTQLRERGLIARIDANIGKRGGNAIWKLTTAGDLRAAQLAGTAQ